MATFEQFFMVWTPSGKAPTKKHEKYKDACDEAARLASHNQDKDFYILQAVKRCRFPKVVWEDVEFNDEIPF